LLPPGDTALPYRGVTTADGKRFWVVGHGGLVKTVQYLFTDHMLPQPVSGTAKEATLGDWNDIYTDGVNAIWIVGQGGYYLRLDADGKNPLRYQQGTSPWKRVTGVPGTAWLMASARLLKVSSLADDVDTPKTGMAEASTIGGTADNPQELMAVHALDADRLFVVGSPTQLIRLDGSDQMAVSGPPLSAGVNAFFDVHGDPAGRLMACGALGKLVELGAEGVVDVPAEGLPASYGYKRVWAFSDGATYLLTSFGDLYYRGPQQ